MCIRDSSLSLPSHLHTSPRSHPPQALHLLSSPHTPIPICPLSSARLTSPPISLLSHTHPSILVLFRHSPFHPGPLSPLTRPSWSSFATHTPILVLFHQDIKEGSGDAIVEDNDTASVQYRGLHIEGKRGEGVLGPLFADNVATEVKDVGDKGLGRGLRGMKVGGKRVVVLAAGAYDARCRAQSLVARMFLRCCRHLQC
eukprot:2055917-Rhodomonas_salina.1